MEASFEVGERVRHKLTQIEGKIVQLEQSLAMPHAWVIEPSVCEINPPKLYRLIDLEKVEEQEDKQTVTQELLENISEASACDQFNLSKCNGSTLNKCDADLLSSSNEVLLEDKKEETFFCNDSTSNQLLEDKKQLPTQDNDSTLNQLLEDKRNDLTLNQLLEDKRNDSTLNQLLEDKRNDSTLNQLLEDKRNDSTLNQLLEDKRNDSTLNQLLEDKKQVPTHRNDLTSNQLLVNQFPHTLSQPLPQRRVKGNGSGCIYWRTVVRNGFEYQQAYYQYEFWQNGQCLLKSTKYISKKLLKQVLNLDRNKAPVSEILEVLGVARK